ncbi:hypothetical protein Nepgr_027609 [Nepenthes gracilis]|uniref:Uncharacterized protein n=1 Tax=Nepenthes gracilis TaxID=150966 RepID=A0AAD3TAT6_NEPGR|nr:hypothetical protein Nepgr_027609 [Nepenthes gracilis]
MATRPNHSFGLFSREFAWHHGLNLFGTMSTLFLLNTSFCGQNLFQEDIFSTIINTVQEVYETARALTLIVHATLAPDTGSWQPSSIRWGDFSFN